MTAVDTTLPLAVAVRLEIQEAAANHKALDYKAILARIEADDEVSPAELKAVQQALAAEIAEGTIDAAKGKSLMSVIAGRLMNTGSAEDRATIRQTVTAFDTLSLTNEQLTAAAAGAKRHVDHGLLAKDVRAASADGSITGAELAKLWQKAQGSDGTVSVGDIKTIYNALDGMKRAGKIDDKQHAALKASMDASLAARSGHKEVDANGRDYIRANNTAHALTDGSPASPATWTNALDMLEFATRDAGDGRKLSAGTVVAFADMVRKASKPVSDTVARAVASALDTAVASGDITAADAKAIARNLDRGIAHERDGIAARSDFSLVFAASKVLNPPAADTTPPVGDSTLRVTIPTRPLYVPSTGAVASDLHASMSSDTMEVTGP